MLENPRELAPKKDEPDKEFMEPEVKKRKKETYSSAISPGAGMSAAASSSPMAASSRSYPQPTRQGLAQAKNSTSAMAST